MANAASSITRLAEILNGAATTQQELHQYLSPDAKRRFHVNEAVEARLRDLLLQAVERDARWQETLASISRPWRETLAEIETLGRSSILHHASHSGEAKCHCWREARAKYYEAIDRHADDRAAVAEFEALWDALVMLSETHRPPKDDPAADALAALPNLVADSVESLLVEALPFLGSRRNRR